MSHRDWENELSELIVRKLDGSLSDDEFKRLETLLSEDTATVEFYVKTIITNALLEDKSCIPMDEEELVSTDLSDSAIWNALLYTERTAPGIAPIRSVKETKKSVQETDVRIPAKISRLHLFTVLASAAALLFILLLPIIVRPSKEVATLADCMNVQWLEPTTPFEIGQRLRTGKPMRLEKGIVKLDLDDGARFIVEAPAAFQFADSNQIRLSSGRCSVRASGSARGFTVYTPTSRIIDLGTAFGIEVRENGITSTHMFEGKALMTAIQAGASQSASLLSQGQAKQVDVAGHLTDIVYQDKTFVREVDSHQGFVWRGESIDLGDVFLNGNGLGSGTVWQTAIMSSSIMDLPVLLDNTALTDTYIPKIDPQDPCYFAVDHPYIDGVFVPDSGHHPVWVSSLGHIYQDCPDTRGVSWKNLPSNAENVNDKVVVGNETFHKAIVLHSNLGVTFDLEAIRQDFPGVSLTRFQCLIGMRKIPEYIPERVRDSVHRMDLYVLLDGQERVALPGITPADAIRPVSIPIQSHERFLTLMATEGSDQSIDFDLGVFAKPYLVLE